MLYSHRLAYVTSHDDGNSKLTGGCSMLRRLVEYMSVVPAKDLAGEVLEITAKGDAQLDVQEKHFIHQCRPVSHLH